MHQFYLDGKLHTAVDYEGRRIRTLSQVLRNGDLELRTYTEEGSIVIDTRCLESRTVMIRRLEHWKPRTKVKASAVVAVAPKRTDLPEHLACTCLCALAYTKQETEEERIAGEEAENRAAERLAKRLFGPGWASLAVIQYDAEGEGEGEEPAAAPARKPSEASHEEPVDAAPPLSDEPVPEVPAEFDLTGVWTVDDGRSDALEPLLKELGVPWVARKAAAAITVTITMMHTAQEVTMVDKSRLFENRTHVVLDGAPRQKKGDDGKMVTIHAFMTGREPYPLPTGVASYGDAQADVEGTFVFCVALPDGMGRTVEMRWRDGAGACRGVED